MTGDDEIKDMASMLLKGATMLPIHCGNCKSPLFEKGGQTLCPKCGRVKIMTEEEAAEEAKKAKAEEPKAPQVDDKVVAVLEKKRQALLEDLDKEQDPEKMTKILEAIDKINSML